MLFQSTSRSVLDKLEVERLDKYLNALGKEQNNSSDIIRSYLRNENSSINLIEMDKFIENPF